MTTTLNTEEKTLLQFWLADGAPGYTGVSLNMNNQITRVPLQQKDYAEIGALDNDVVRDYLSKYLPSKIAWLTNDVASNTTQLSQQQEALAKAKEFLTTVSNLFLQTVPTNA